MDENVPRDPRPHSEDREYLTSLDGYPEHWRCYYCNVQSYGDDPCPCRTLFPNAKKRFMHSKPQRSTSRVKYRKVPLEQLNFQGQSVRARFWSYDAPVVKKLTEEVEK